MSSPQNPPVDSVTASVAGVSLVAPDLLASNYGHVTLDEVQSKAVTGRKWNEIMSVTEELKDHRVLIRGRVQTIRHKGKKIAFLVVRERLSTVQCVLTGQIVKFAKSLTKECFVEVEGIVSFGFP